MAQTEPTVMGLKIDVMDSVGAFLNEKHLEIGLFHWAINVKKANPVD